jgi:hypothetical protein
LLSSFTDTILRSALGAELLVQVEVAVVVVVVVVVDVSVVATAVSLVVAVAAVLVAENCVPVQATKFRAKNTMERMCKVRINTSAFLLARCMPNLKPAVKELSC